MGVSGLSARAARTLGTEPVSASSGFSRGLPAFSDTYGGTTESSETAYTPHLDERLEQDERLRNQRAFDAFVDSRHIVPEVPALPCLRGVDGWSGACACACACVEMHGRQVRGGV